MTALSMVQAVDNKARCKAYYAKNSDKVKKKHTEYYLNNLSKLQAYGRNYYRERVKNEKLCEVQGG